MAEEPTSTLTKKYVSAANGGSSKPTKATSTTSTNHSKLITWFGHLLTGVSAIGAALLSTSGMGTVQSMESQALSTFFQLRGPVVPPEDIVILAIDNDSISVPEQYYKTNPQQYAYLEPLKSYPFKRAAYAEVIEKLMQAGAKAVAVAVVFDTSSSYGVADDRQLQAVLQKYGNKVTLAAVYEESWTEQGKSVQLRQPQLMFHQGSVSMGTVNFPIEADGKVHRLTSEYPKLLPENDLIADKLPSFNEAVLRAAEINYPRPKGDHIYFWGPAGTFKQFPFWHVFDPENWQTYLHQGKVFQNKIVVIGATAQLANNFYPVADSSNPERMSGVEIHANEIATLMTGKAIAPAIVSPPLRGLFVLVIVTGAIFLCTRSKRGINRFISSIGLASIWGVMSYVLFVHDQLIFPTTIPMVAIAFSGLSYLGTEVARESIKKRQLIDIFRKHQSSAVVQEIISQQDDLQDLLQQRDLALAGKILGGRYKIVKVLGSGGFSETYIAEDIQRPGNPRCVVKQLKPANTKTTGLQLARRLFNSEAQTLERLGKHQQIPQLLAYFEQEEEFYLVQEFIVGHPLSQELQLGQSVLEAKVIDILRDLLQTLAFVHENSVIHRDIKPSNIIRRHSDWKLVLIDFGAVKEVSALQMENQEHTPFTIGIGTKGYAPNEQCFGRPQYSSDIYAVGMIGIKALTGIAPHEFARDSEGELLWQDQAAVSQTLAEILSKMVLEDYKQRYQTAIEALEAFNQLIGYTPRNYVNDNQSSIKTAPSDDPDASTTPWE
ncbi:serine/threonine protein kinase with Chase2 sensor [Calothrix sp. NIES-2100]|uniref:CHASE2 domain-containing protein n=1 Tax=Calothrix sp. NIES-2100 TaxID=1954172 RepID=UPI000B604DC9|nr:serine/threonine protein kinase with Chase2 sensor [Calothrix sp. NIES-2100]